MKLNYDLQIVFDIESDYEPNARCMPISQQGCPLAIIKRRVSCVLRRMIWFDDALWSVFAEDDQREITPHGLLVDHKFPANNFQF